MTWQDGDVRREGGFGWWRDPAAVSRWAPLAAAGLLEVSRVSQLLRMWVEGSARGQSLIGWAVVGLALVVWLHFHRTVTPRQTMARVVTWVGIAMTLVVFLTVAYYRFLA